MKRLLTNLAIVQSHLDEKSTDYLDSFLPLMATLIRKKGYRSLASNDVETVVRDFISEFGIEIKHHPAVSLIKKCKRLKLIREDNGSLIIDNKRIARYDITLQVAISLKERLIPLFRLFQTSASRNIHSNAQSHRSKWP